MSATAANGLRLPPDPAVDAAADRAVPASADGDGVPPTALAGAPTEPVAPAWNSSRPGASAAVPPAAVLWDMDGTLVDTEPYWIACEFDLVAEHGGSWSLEHAHALVGNALLESAVYIRRHGGVDLPPEEIVERLLDGVVARVREHVPWRPGARELLADLNAAGVPCALVTMSYRRLAQAVLDGLPDGTFAALVAGDDVTHGKPHPEPYLTAAARLGAAPRACVAIEDSRTGVASAEAAGVPVLAVQHLLPLDAAPGRRVVDSLSGITTATLTEIHAGISAAHYS